MDEEQLKAYLADLLPTMLPGLLEPFTTGLTETFLGDVRAFLEKPESKATTSPDPDPEKQALVERLAALEARDKERETATRKADFESVLNENLDRYKPTFRDQVLKELGAQFDKAKQGPNGWQLEGGKTVAETVDAFFSTEYGKHLLPSTHKDGVATPDPAPVTSAPERSTGDLLREAFLG